MNPCARCNWQPQGDETIEQHAEAAEHPLCTACQPLRKVDPASLPSDRPRVCRDCQDHASRLLDEVLELWGELPDLLSAHAGDPLPGGDALVLAGPGARGPQGVDDEDVRWLVSDNRNAYMPSVAWTLVSWVDDWRHVRKEGDGTQDHTRGHDRVVLDAHAYLREHGPWAAAEHWAWVEYALDLAHVHHRLMRATGRHREASRLNLDCLRCGGALVYRIVQDHEAPPPPARPRWWVDKHVLGPVDLHEYMRRHLGQAGLEEGHATCRKCGQKYDATKLMVAQQDAVQKAQWLDYDDGKWGTTKVIAEELGRAESTLLAWRRDGAVRSYTPAGSRVVYLHVGDVLDHHETVKAAQWFEDDEGVRWGTVRAVADEVERSQWTLRTWQRQQLVRSQWRDGDLYLRLPDVQAEVELRAPRTRSRRRRDVEASA